MVTVSLAEARDNIEALLDRVERGEDVLITREGAPAPAPVEKVPLSELLPGLKVFRESMPPLRKPSAELIREMRDEGY